MKLIIFKLYYFFSKLKIWNYIIVSHPFFKLWSYYKKENFNKKKKGWYKFYLNYSDYLENMVYTENFVKRYIFKPLKKDAKSCEKSLKFEKNWSENLKIFSCFYNFLLIRSTDNHRSLDQSWNIMIPRSAAKICQI